MKTHGPWKTLNTKTAYESPWIRVEHSDVLTPGQKSGTYSVVNFKNAAVGIVVLDENFNTWIVGQYRYPLKRNTWEIPEGGCPLGTPLLETAKRELMEEVGISAKKWTPIMDLHLSNSATDEYGIIYIAQNIEIGEASPEDDEDIEIKKLPFEEFYQMVENGIITDSMSVAAAYKVKLMILDGRLKKL